MKKKKQFRKSIFLAIIFIIAAAVILNVITIYKSSKVYQTEEIDMFIKVSNYTGFNVDTGALNFGTVPTSGKATKLIKITNLDKMSKVILTVDGGLAEWMMLPDNITVLYPGEEIDLPVSIAVPGNAPSGDYSGKLRIRFIKP